MSTPGNNDTAKGDAESLAVMTSEEIAVFPTPMARIACPADQRTLWVGDVPPDGYDDPASELWRQQGCLDDPRSCPCALGDTDQNREVMAAVAGGREGSPAARRAVSRRAHATIDPGAAGAGIATTPRALQPADDLVATPEDGAQPPLHGRLIISQHPTGADMFAALGITLGEPAIVNRSVRSDDDGAGEPTAGG